MNLYEAHMVNTALSAMGKTAAASLSAEEVKKRKKKLEKEKKPGVPIRLREKLGPRWRKKIDECPYEPGEEGKP